MPNTPLKRKLQDQEYERRTTRQLITHGLMLLPLLVFALLIYGETRHLPATAVTITCATYLAVSLLTYARVRRDTLGDMRREGLIGEDYEPPDF